VLLPLRLLAQGEPTPGAIVTISPWADLTIQNPTMDTNADKDITLSRQALELFRSALLQDPALSFTDPEISILYADLTGLPPTALFYGDYEILAGEDAEFGRRLSDFKVTSEVHSLPQTQHSFILGAGRVPETDAAIEQMADWLNRHLGH
jgi:monoterpene epsilon-lactone hydrolase